MKHQIIALLIFVFGLCVSSSIMVYADEETSVVTEISTVSAQDSDIENTEVKTVTADKVVKKPTVIKKRTTIKANKKVKLKKLLHLSGKSWKKYSYSINHSKIAKVSKKGIVTGMNAGKAVVTVKSKETHYVCAKVTVTVENRYANSELRLLSSLIYCEARGESYAGQKAVGIVTTNRVSSGLFPNTLSGVVYQSGQYTPARSGALVSALRIYDSGNMKKSCIKAAKETLNGSKTVSLSSGEVNMSGYLFFSGYVNGCRLQIGGHQFK